MVTIFGVQLDWGKFPDWITAVVAGASAMVAAFTYRSSVRDKQRAQAYQVAAWVALDEQGKNRVFVANRSEASIFEVTVYPKGNIPLKLWELPPHATAQALLPNRIEETRSMSVSVSMGFASASASSTQQRISYRPELTFRDSLGRGWRQTARGDLRRQREWTSVSGTKYETSSSVPFFGNVTAKVSSKDRPRQQQADPIVAPDEERTPPQ